MRVRAIHVRNLFDTFDHDIDLDSPERIKILHGPNGFGKTTILRMVSDFFSGRYSEYLGPSHFKNSELTSTTIEASRSPENWKTNLRTSP